MLVVREQLPTGLDRAHGLELLRGMLMIRRFAMDFLNFVIAVHAALHVEIPEADYPKLATLDGCVDYLVRAGGP